MQKAVSQAELSEKRGRLDALRRKRGLDAMLLTTNANIAWATGGGRAHIVLAQESGVGALLLDEHGVRLLTNNIEEGRLLEEELPAGDWRPVVSPWYHESLTEALRIAGVARVGADAAVPGTENCAQAIVELRTPLLEPEVERYRALGRDTGEALEAAARGVRPGDSEFEIAARIAPALVERGIDAVVLLVAVDERILRIRHPLPTTLRVDERAMLVCCGRRHGLIASVTRLAQLGKLPGDLRLRHDACARVDGAYLAATVDGATAGEVFAAGAAAYAAEGYPGEWQFHHQGGAAGYSPRDWLGMPDGQQVVQQPQAFAWNPSIAGTKVEDTVILHNGAIEVITATGNWPTVEVRVGERVFQRPAILELPTR